MEGQFEIVIYRLKPDVDRSRFLEISNRATEWLRQRPGYLGRELLEDESGQWVDLVRWATMDDALAAASAFMDVPEAAAFMDAVEPESITMLHPRSVVNYELGAIILELLGGAIRVRGRWGGRRWQPSDDRPSATVAVDEVTSDQASRD